MDLRTFFGNWAIGQPILITHTEDGHSTRYIAKLEQFNDIAVLISTEDPETQHPFRFALDVDIILPDGPFYSLELKPGQGIVPSYYKGNGLKGTTLIDPLFPPVLIVSGKYAYYSNTVMTEVAGTMNFSQRHSDQDNSFLEINIIRPNMNKTTFHFSALMLE